MAKSFAGVLIFVIAAVVLSACGQDGRASGGENVGTPGPTPNPLNVHITVDDSRAVSARVSIEGGTIEAEAADGTLYTLAIPSDALLTETEVTVTPVIDVDGAPVIGGRLVGVQLAPDGLRLYQHAVLTVTPSGMSPAVEALAFTSHDNGQELRLFPLDADPSSITFRLLHFSEDFGYLDIGEGTQLTVDPDTFVPTDWESQLEHSMAELFKAERDAQLRGESGNPDFAEILEALIRAKYAQVIAPLLPTIATDCSSFDANNGKVLGWVRTAELAVLGAAFSHEIGEVNSALLSGADRCWQEAIEPCVDPDDGAQMNRLGALARQAIFLGGDAGKYNPHDPDLHCDGLVWTGTVAYTESENRSEDGGQYSTQVQLQVSFGEGASTWSATASESYDSGWDECIRSHGQMTTSGSGGAAFGVFEDGEWTWTGDPGVEGALLVELRLFGPDAYQVWITPPALHGTMRNVSEERPPCSSEYDKDEWDSDWQMIDTPEIFNQVPDPSNPDVIEGSYTRGDAETGTRTWSWRFEKQGESGPESSS